MKSLLDRDRERSYTNLQNKRDYSPRPKNLNSYSRLSNNYDPLNKTTTSIHSQHLWNTLQELQLFPAELSQLLRNQDRNITLFKNRIQKQKAKVNQDVDTYKKQTLHYIDDFKLSLMAQLDNIYKCYMERYAKLKGQVLEIKRLRDQIQFQIANKSGQSFGSINGGSNVKTSRLTNGGNYLSANNLNGSNLNTVKSIQNGLKDMKKYHILNYISQLQKSKITPVSEDAKSLIILTQYDNGFFLPKQLSKALSNQKQDLKYGLRGLFDSKHQFIRDVESVIGKQRDTHQMLEMIDNDSPQDRYQRQKRQKQRLNRQKFQKQRQRLNRQKDKERQFEQLMQRQKEWQLQKQRQRQRQRENYNKNQNKIRSHPIMSQNDQDINYPKSNQNDSRQVGSYPQKYQSQIPVSQSYQTAVYSWLENPKATLNQQVCIRPDIQNFDNNPQNNIILCALLLPNDQIVIGGKNGQLLVYHLTSGQKICSLKGHQASICSLAIITCRDINQETKYLASGSDHGCNCILLWDLSSLSLRHKLEGHKAAVTAIVDLMDGQNMVSGSYDKKINIYNLKTGKISYNLPTNKSSVTGIVLNNNATKMISCGLDNSLNVWQIIRSQNNPSSYTNQPVQTLFLERIIQNNVMICSMVGSMMNQDIVYIGTKDGKVKTIDIEKGQSYQTITCCDNAIIQMIVLERQSHPNHPMIVAWPCKQECFKIINTENGKISNVQARGHIQFGCGIGPKGLFLSKNGKGFIGMLSQSPQRKEINFYKIQSN